MQVPGGGKTTAIQALAGTLVWPRAINASSHFLGSLPPVLLCAVCEWPHCLLGVQAQDEETVPNVPPQDGQHPEPGPRAAGGIHAAALQVPGPGVHRGQSLCGQPSFAHPSLCKHAPGYWHHSRQGVKALLCNRCSKPVARGGLRLTSVVTAVPAARFLLPASLCATACLGANVPDQRGPRGTVPLPALRVPGWGGVQRDRERGLPRPAPEERPWRLHHSQSILHRPTPGQRRELHLDARGMALPRPLLKLAFHRLMPPGQAEPNV